MTTTYSTNKGYALQGTGDNVNSWGTVLNTQCLDVIDSNLGGTLDLSLSGNVTLNSTQAQNLFYYLTGTLSSNVTITFPEAGGFYIINNQTSGGYIVNIAATGCTGTVSIPQGAIVMVGVDLSDLLVFQVTTNQTLTTLNANLNLYVSTTGSDSNNGLTSGTAFLTIQKAINTCYQYNLNGYTITINVALGTYTGAISVIAPFIGDGSVILLGNTTTPTNYILSTSSTTITVKNSGSILNIEGFEITTSVGNGIYATRGGQVNVIGNMNYGACAGFQNVADDGGKIYLSTNYTISGNALGHYVLNDAGANIVITGSPTVTLSGTPAFTNFVSGSGASTLNAIGITFSGSATGQRFNISQNTVVNTGTSGNLTYFPGSTAGTYTQGAQYDQLNSNMAVGTGLASANNLSDVASASTSLTNLGGLAKANNLSDLASRTGALGNLGFGDVAGGAGVQIPDNINVNWRIIKGSFTTSGGGPTTLTLPQSYANSGTWDIVLTSNNSGANIASMNTYNKTANTVQVSAAGSGSTYVGITADYIAFGY